MAQGKLHSSPFHIETSNYKYAIEHESDDCQRGTFLIECRYLAPSTRHCTLWNSGHSKSCAQFGCKYLILHEHPKALSCVSCAYCFAGRCFAPKKPEEISVQLSEATYCCFFLKEKTDWELFRRIRRYCERIYYTEQIDICQKAIISIENEIQAAQISHNSKNILTESECRSNDIQSRLAVLTERLKTLTAQLNKSGGRLDAFPKIRKTGKKKIQSRG